MSQEAARAEKRDGGLRFGESSSWMDRIISCLALSVPSPRNEWRREAAASDEKTLPTLIKTERRPAQVLLARLWGCRSTGRINNNYEAFKHSCPQRCWGRPPPPSPRASRTADAPENRGVPATRESSAACRMSRTKMSAQEPASPGERGITTASPTPQGLCD